MVDSWAARRELKMEYWMAAYLVLLTDLKMAVHWDAQTDLYWVEAVADLSVALKVELMVAKRDSEMEKN